MQSREEGEQALEEARQRVQNLIVAQLQPGLSPDKSALLNQLERSSRAEARLRHKALAHYDAENSPSQQTQTEPSEIMPTLASTKPGTSGSIT
jgi:hypothetical protein